MDDESNAGKELESMQSFFSEANLKGSTLTVNVLLSFLQQFPILAQPSNGYRRFTWYKALSHRKIMGESSYLQSCIEDPRKLYICSIEDARTVLDQRSFTFVLATTDESTVPSWALESNYRERLILIQIQGAGFYLVSCIQSLFSGLVAWAMTLDRIVLSSSSITELLDECTLLLNNFICVTDSGFNLVSSTTKLKPVDDSFVNLIQNGCFSISEIQELEKMFKANGETQKRPNLDNSHILSQNSVVHAPIFFHGEQFFHLFMPCSSDISIAAAIDLIEVASRYLTKACSNYWNTRIELLSPWYKVLTRYINRKEMNKNYLEAQLSSTKLLKAVQFRLYCIEFQKGCRVSYRTHIADLSKKLNGERCYPFAYRGTLLVLCYAETEDYSRFAKERCIEDIDTAFAGEDDFNVGLSRTFRSLDNLSTAYSQARIALNFTDVIDEEHRYSNIPNESRCYDFDSALHYYLLVLAFQQHKHEELNMRPGVVESLQKEDDSFGTNVVQLLWSYLLNERNATAVSRKLNMHRNTVIYHIEKIENRYGISFDDLANRNSILMEFKLLFLTKGYKNKIDCEARLRLCQAKAD